MSQPYPPGPSGQPQQGQPQQGQPGGYQQPGYPQGGYPQPGQPTQNYGSYQSPASPYGGGGGRSNPLNHPASLAPILQILGYVLAGLGVLGFIIAFTIGSGYVSYPGTYKFFLAISVLVSGLGFGGVLLALSALLKSRSSS